MPKQLPLELRREALEALWRRLPAQARQALVEQYARLIARAAQSAPSKQGAAKR